MSDQLLNIKLVGEVEKRPLLFNNTIPEYSRKDLTEKAWSEVGKEVKLTVHECKEKWRNLRAVFIRHMKPYLNGSTPKQKKPYYLTEAMLFTLPYIKAISVPPQLQPYAQEPEEDDLDDYEDYPEEGTSSDTPATMVPIPKQPMKPTLPSEPQDSTDPLNSRRSTIKLKLEEVEQTWNDYMREKKMENILNGNMPPNSRSEGFKMFLLSLMPDLEMMTDTEVRRFKINALQIIEEIVSSK